MSNAAEIRRRNNFLAGQLVIAAFVIGYGLAALLLLPIFQGVRIAALYLAPVGRFTLTSSRS